MSLKNIAIAFDQLINTLLGSAPDETLSAKAWRMRLVSTPWHIAQVVIDALFFWQTEHCKAAYFSEYERKQLPGEYRK